MPKEKINYKALAVWIALGFSIGWFSNSALAGNSVNSVVSVSEVSAETVDMTLFWDVWNSLKKNYVDAEKLNTTTEVYGAIAGLVNALEDPYTVFMTPEETTSFHESLGGELEGIGAELSVEEGLLVVVSPLKGSPAEKAGLLPGDYIYLVDGKATSDMTLFDAIKAIRGQQGTQVELTVIRKTVEEPFVIKITRDKINVPSVELSYKEEGGKEIAILNVYQFGDNTSLEFTTATNDILLKDADGLVLDLRMNGGGYLDTSIEMLTEFFKEKVKAVIVKRRDSDNEVIYTNGNGKLTEMPMVVLINEGSASASEILAGALQDYKRAVIMGVKSYGKGSVQELSALNDGSSLRMTIAKWYTPNDRSIDHTGIEPDIKLEMETSKMGTAEDTQLRSAIDYIKNL